MLPCATLRAPVDTIAAPLFPRDLEWVNVASLRMEKQRGRPVLVEFWDCCRVNSLRTLPYLQAWHERYEAAGLRVIGVHSPGFEPSGDPAVVRETAQRLGIVHPVVLDHDLTIWHAYENRGWPARYLFGPELRLFEYHFGEGGYADTERAIQELLGITGEVVAPVHPEDDPAAQIAVPTPEQPGAYSGPYEAGGVWAVLEGRGMVAVNGEQREVAFTGAHELVRHARHTEAVLELEIGDGVTCHATSFTPGLAP